jgi:hypothetical protein
MIASSMGQTFSLKISIQPSGMQHLLEGLPSISIAPSSFTTPRVRVPVLSVQRISMLPKFSMEDSLRTITPADAISCEPLEDSYYDGRQKLRG